MYDIERLPSARDCSKLTRLVDGFPATIEEFMWTANAEHFDVVMRRYLAAFPEGTIFESPEDFLDRRDDMRLFHNEEKALQAEQLRSPQD